MHRGFPHDDDIVPPRPGWEPPGSGAGYQPPPPGGWTAPAPQTSPPPSPGSGASPYGFDDPTGQFADIPVGSPQWYAQMSQNPNNLEQMLEEATGKNITTEWLEDYAAFLPTYDPTGEQFAEGRYNLAQERYGLAGKAYDTAGKQYGLAQEGYQQQLGSIFSQAGEGTMDLLSSWQGGGQTMTGRKGRQRSRIGTQAKAQAAGARGQLKQAGLQYDRAGQAYAGAGITLGEADITRAADIYGMREDYARELRSQLSDLSQQEAFVDLHNAPTNTNWTNPQQTSGTWGSPYVPPNTWNPDTNTWANEDAAYQAALMNRPLLEEDDFHG